MSINIIKNEQTQLFLRSLLIKDSKIKIITLFSNA
jgi:hypothetical protein